MLTVTWSNVPAGNGFTVVLSLNVTEPGRLQYSNAGSVTINGVPTEMPTVTLKHRAACTGDGDFGGISIKKFDAANHDTTQGGAVFELRDRTSGAVVKTLTTGVDGMAKEINIPVGDYDLVETKGADRIPAERNTAPGQGHPDE